MTSVPFWARVRLTSAGSGSSFTPVTVTVMSPVLVLLARPSPSSATYCNERVKVSAAGSPSMVSVSMLRTPSAVSASVTARSSELATTSSPVKDRTSPSGSVAKPAREGVATPVFSVNSKLPGVVTGASLSPMIVTVTVAVLVAPSVSATV